MKEALIPGCVVEISEGDAHTARVELPRSVARIAIQSRRIQPTALEAFRNAAPWAELYRRQLVLGLDGDPNAASKARVFLRKWFGGKDQARSAPGRRIHGPLKSKRSRARGRPGDMW